jgi:hypothetical protein
MRNPKQIRISKILKLCVSTDFLNSNLGFVSDFGIRISNLYLLNLI